MKRTLLVLATLVAGTTSVHAQMADPTGPAPARPSFAMGQPPIWRPYASAFGVIGTGGGGRVGGLAGIHRAIRNPIVGLLGVSGEALGETRGGDDAAGVRLLATAPVFGLALGADWRPAAGNVATIVSFQSAIRRGGLLGHGSMARLDWLPARHALGVGIQFPLFQPFAGRTRPRRTTARVPAPDAIVATRGLTGAPLPDSAARALSTVRDAASLIAVYTRLYHSADEATLAGGAERPYGRSFDAVSRAYIAALASAFGVAAGDSRVGDSLASHARAIVLDDVVLPYDGLFGQVKTHGTLAALMDAARARYASWLRDSSTLALPVHAPVLAVYDRWLAIIRDLANRIEDEWADSRLVWLPAQLALAIEEHDEQSEVDSLIARAVGHAFTDSNSLGYLSTADLTVEIARSISAARNYHVLWTHDFTGRRLSGELDQVAYTMVADAYLPALTAAVQRYDTSATMPQFFVLVDAFYYNARDGRIWMSILENPLQASIHLRSNEAREAAHLRERLDALRAAVARSRRLQREAAANGGDRWLARVVAVHVNVTQPSDFSFRSHRIIPPIPFTPDNVSRDHRKLALYDFTEADPYAGELLVTGIGIGEHYASNTWEDRGYRLRGPAALPAREEVRRALLANGFDEDQIPPPLRITREAASPRSGRRAAARVLHVHNEPGFGAKESSVARAMLYTLTPPGSVIIVPDPLWLSASWAAMLAGAAARGSTVMVIAPAKANAPSPEPSVLALERDVMQHLVRIRQRLAASPNEAFGVLHVGLYASTAPITDVSGRIREISEGLARNPWIRDVIPFDSSALAVLSRANAQAGRSDAAATNIAQDMKPRAPQLHQKTQLIARPGAIAALVRQPGWEDVLAQTIRTQARQTARLADAIGAPSPPADTAAVQAADARVQGYERSLTPADRRRLSFYFMVGSQNHDPRGLMLDGEASVIVSGFEGSAGLVDLFYLMARTTWVDQSADIDRLVPAPSSLMQRVAHLVRFAM